MVLIESETFKPLVGRKREIRLRGNWGDSKYQIE